LFSQQMNHNAEFLVGHGYTPYRTSWVLHSVFAAADPKTLR
jgi:hypothetical protein